MDHLLRSWINDGGHDTFRPRDRRVNRRQTADDSETYRAGTVDGARRHWRPLWRMSLCCGGEIIARGNAAWWNSGIVGAFLGYSIRRRLDLHIKDLVVAVCEDLFAVGLALFFVSR